MLSLSLQIWFQVLNVKFVYYELGNKGSSGRRCAKGDVLKPIKSSTKKCLVKYNG